MKQSIDWSKTIFFFIALSIGAVSAYFGQPLIHGNGDATNIIVTVFSILAGFLIAILAVVGDPVMLSPGTWRSAEMDEKKINARLLRHKMLFELYLVTLILVFFSVLWKDPKVVIWFERFSLFFGAVAFVYSYQLPRVLMQAQKERIDAEIKRRRKKKGLDGANARKT